MGVVHWLINLEEFMDWIACHRTISLLILISIIFLSCKNNCEFWGSHALGKNLYLLEGDRVEDRLIVYSKVEEGDCCTGGASILPTYEQHMLNGRYNNYVLQAISNENWILAKLKNAIDEKVSYWRIDLTFDLDLIYCETMNCPEFYRSRVSGPYDLDQMQIHLDDQNIDLKLEDLEPIN